MKFYGTGTVWDASANKVLCKFVDGEFETKDRYVMERVLSFDYRHDEIDKVLAKTMYTDAELAIIKELEAMPKPEQESLFVVEGSYEDKPAKHVARKQNPKR